MSGPNYVIFFVAETYFIIDFVPANLRANHVATF